MSLGDTSSAKLRFAPEILPIVAGANTYAKWWDLPFTSESLTEKLTSAQSAAMRDDRQMAGTRLVRGEAGGDVGIETAFGNWMDLLLQAALQSPTEFGLDPTQPANGAGDGTADDEGFDNTGFDWDMITNGKNSRQFAFEKKLTGGDGNDYFSVFRGCQINTLNFDFQSNSLANATVGVRGLSTEDNGVARTGTEEAYDLDDQFDTSANAKFEFFDQDDSPLPVTAQNMSLSIDNQMRGQQAIGSFGDAGVASGRIKVMMSGSFYFYDKSLTNKFKANSGIKVYITLTNSAGFKYRFRMYNVKVTSDDLAAGGADQDLVQPLELQSFPDATYNRTITVDRLVPETA